MTQFLGARTRLRQHLVSEGQQVSGDPGGRIDQERQQIDLGVPKVVPLIGLSGEAFRRHACVLRARRGLQDVKEVEADRLLNLDRAALYPVLPDVLDTDIAPTPEIVHVVLLSGEQRFESISHY